MHGTRNIKFIEKLIHICCEISVTLYSSEVSLVPVKYLQDVLRWLELCRINFISIHRVVLYYTQNKRSRVKHNILIFVINASYFVSANHHRALL